MKKRVGFVFLILHFGPVRLTLDTLESVLALPEDDKAIVVVDNGSHEAAPAIGERFPSDDRIIVTETEKNLGFSAGNNAGFALIRQNFDTDFVIVINNDMSFEDRSFLSTLRHLYEETGFFVAGPDVYTPNEVLHSNPFREKVMDIEDAKAQIGRHVQKMKDYEHGRALHCLVSFCRRKKNPLYIAFRKVKTAIHPDTPWKKRQEGVVLQGSCLIFDRRFIEGHDKLFEPEVFLYHEEDFLALRCKREGLKMVYLPEIRVWHMHAGSAGISGMGFKEFCRGSIERRRMMADSCRKYLEMLSQ